MDREQVKQEIRRRISCKNYLTKSKGKLYCCPFCGSGTGTHKTGALELYDTNTWYCHACKRSGDVIDLYEEQTGADFNTAISLLAKEAGIETEEAPRGAQRQEKEKEDIKHGGKDKTPPRGAESATGESRADHTEEDRADYTQYYEQCSRRINDPAAIKYLNSRYITLETAAAYNLGYDPQADPANAPGAQGSEYRPHACPRIIAPCSKSYYVARSIDPDTPAAYKAINPNQKKGGGQVALFNAQAISSGADVIFITEGLFDALSFLEAGQQAIALNGKGNGKLLLDLLQDQQTQAAFIIVPDNDSDAKTNADTKERAEALKKGLLQQGYKAIVYNVAGQEHDANDALVKSVDTFTKNIEAAKKELNRDELTDFFELIQTDAYKPYKTELSFFDDLLGGGVIRQTLLLLLAAPGTGKTTLCAQIAEQMAAHKKPVIYINLEMSKEQMLAKAISSRLARKGKPLTALQVMQGYSWTDEQRAAVHEAVDEYREKIEPYLKYNPDGIGSDLDAIREYIDMKGQQATAAGQQAPVIVLDYLHLISSSKGLDTQELIKQAVVMLKQYAIKYNTFVIGIVATNRTSNAAGRVTMESGRDSSNLEYTADYQLSLNYYALDKGKLDTSKDSYNDELAKIQGAKWRQMIIRVLKGRFCPPGKSAKVYFNAESGLFYGENDFMPADSARIPFETEPAAGSRLEITAIY